MTGAGRPLKIGIDVRWIGREPNGGLATYLKALITHLGAADSLNRYTVYFPDARVQAHTDYLPAHFKTTVLRPTSRLIQLPIGLPWELIRRPVDLLHVIAVAPPLCPVPIVQTLNDVAWETNPELFPKLLRLRLSTLVPLTAKRARKIITVSEFSKKEIMKFYGIPDEKIVVTYHGVDPVYQPCQDSNALAELREKYGTAKDFILYVGKIYARKNLTRLVRAFATLKRDTALPHQLVFVGNQTWLSDEILTAVRELGRENEILLVGEVPLADVPLFYSAASLFVFPSLCEGYGLPPLEAMACGTPVVASNATSIPEVVGDAAVLVDPYDERALAKAMFDVLSQPGLSQQLVERGFKRVRDLSSHAMATQVIDLYREVTEGSVNGRG
jgi:glycosyltransferase involved in cell wall biosynthesis